MSKNIFEIIDRIIIIITIALCSTGTIGNIVSLLISIRKELRKTPTFVFMAFLSAINILRVLTIGCFLFILHFMIDSVQDLNNYFYNIIVFLICFEYQSSSYLKV